MNIPCPTDVPRPHTNHSRQRALLFYWKREEWPYVREALRHWGRSDLIGRGPECLVPPGPAFGAWTKRRGVQESGGMGMKVVRASRQEEREEAWEAIAEQR